MLTLWLGVFMKDEIFIGASCLWVEVGRVAVCNDRKVLVGKWEKRSSLKKGEIWTGYLLVYFLVAEEKETKEREEN